MALGVRAIYDQNSNIWGLPGPVATVNAWWRPELRWLDSGLYALSLEET